MKGDSAVIWLDAIGEADRSRVGGKAFVLARLRQLGFAVPDGFVLPEAMPVAAAVLAYGRLGGAVAVRSSSTAEDTDEASFAGQYRTVLNVEGAAALGEAVRLCRESKGDALGYARTVGAAAGTMAVLVQRMAAGRAAGVAFTRDPRDPTALVIEATPGLGDALVSGTVTPDRYVLDRTTGAPREASTAGCLSPGDLVAVTELARRVEAALGAPQDVEWALAPEGPVVLQARPITVEADERPVPGLRRLTRANVGEVLPDPVTPLTWSTVGAFLEHAFGGVAEDAGLASAGTGPFLVLYRRRLYLNLSLCAEVAAQLPGVSAADAERLIFGGGAAGEAPPLRLRALPRLVHVLWRLFLLARRLPARVSAAEAACARRPAAETIAGFSSRALADALGAFGLEGRELAFTHVATSGSCGFRLAVLGGVLGRLAPGDTEGRVNRLVTGLENVASTAPAFALEALAEEAQGHADWIAWLRAPRLGSRGLDGAPAALADRLDTFLARFGHRALSEGELGALAWEDDPRPVLAALLALAEGERGADWSRRARAEVRRADEESLLSRFGPLRRWVVGSLIRGAQDAVRERERTKSLTIALVHHGRRLARAAARRLVAEGALDEERSVFLLELPELRDALQGRALPRGRLERRRRRLEREGVLPAPREVDLGSAAALPESGGRGIGVSAGVAIGPARVLLPGDPVHLLPGEVLVTTVLDAALGPLLATAAGAVAEIGAVLSHGAVVARELGVPCVVDVRDATRRFRTGDRLVIDGGAGTVALEAPEGEGAAGDPAAGPPSLLTAEDTNAESLHTLEAHAHARESVYLNVQDPAAGLVLVASAGVRPDGRGEALLALSSHPQDVLFGLDLAPAQTGRDGYRVAGQRVTWRPFRFRVSTRLSRHAAAAFPGAVLPLLLGPRTVAVELDLTFAPTTPAVDFCRGLSEETRRALLPLGAHHLEQSGAWTGAITIDGRRLAVTGTGSRDHSWGQRSWEAADHWRLFTVRFGDDLAVHALAVSARGRMVEGGFVWRDGRAERITRVQYVTERDGRRLRAFDLRVTTAAGPPLRLRGTVVRTLTVPVDVDRRPARHLGGHPYRLVLHENFTRYETHGHVGHGMAELTERPGPADR